MTLASPSLIIIIFIVIDVIIVIINIGKYTGEFSSSLDLLLHQYYVQLKTSLNILTMNDPSVIVSQVIPNEEMVSISTLGQ